MIEKLLSENPRLKKNLLKEAGEYPVLTPREQGMGINIDDTDEIAPLPNEHKILSPSELNRVKEPRKGGLVSALKKIGKYVGGAAITLGMLAIANFHDTTNPSDHNTDHAIHQIAKNNDVLANQIEKELSNDDKLRSQRDEFGPKVIYRAKRPEDFDKIVSDFIISNEGFTSKPHSDVKQVSIGHGTSVSDGTTQIPENWKEILYSRYNIPKKLQKSDPKGRISKETARYIFNIKYEKNKRILDDIEYIHVFPEQIQKIIFDLAFNMGTNFFAKFRNFNTALQQAAECLSGSTITPEDIDNANTHLHVASTELLKNYDEEGKETGPTKYASDLGRRAGENARIIGNGVVIDDFEVHVSEIPYSSYPDVTHENKKYSLKSVFFS
tara:strand:+ start:4636 stop:5784 length:1149 start_codon:yes stop_codon:yes gene_type:complete